ncbi:MAG: Ig domain-containing protein [Bacilli bacterium]
MKNKIVLLPMMMLLLAGCGPATSSVTSSEDDPSINESSIEVPSESSEEVGLLPISDARDVESGEVVNTAGVVTAIYQDSVDDGTFSVAIQDGDIAMLLYSVSAEVLGETAVGDSIEVVGESAPYYETMELNPVTSIVAAETTYTATALEIPNISAITDWSEMDSRLVTIVGTKKPSNTELNTGSNNYYYVWQEQGMVEALAYINRNVGVAAIEAMKPVLDVADPYTENLELTGIVGFYKGAPQVLFYDVANAVVADNPVDDPTALEIKVAGDAAATTVDVAQFEKVRLAGLFTPAAVADRELTWTSSDETLATIDAYGEVTGVAPGTVTITATSVAVPTVTATFEVVVVAGEPMSIADVRALADGVVVPVRGTVTSAPSSGNYTIQTGDAALYLYNVPTDMRTGIEVGDDIVVVGETDNYNGLEQIASISAVTDLGPTLTPIVPAEVTDLATLVAGWDSRLVSIEGLEYVSGSVTIGSHSNITLSLNGTEITLRTNKYTDDTEEQAMKDLIDGLTAGDFVDFDGVLGWYNSAQLAFNSAADLTVAPYVPGTVTAVTVTSEGDATSLAANGTLQLTATVTADGATHNEVTWTSSDELVATVDAAGLVSGVATGTVTITATSSVNTAISDTIELTVTEAVVSLSDTITNEAMGLTGSAYYDGTAVVGDLSLSFTQLFNGTQGTTKVLQMRYKDSVQSSFKNTVATTLAIKSITVTYMGTNATFMEYMAATDDAGLVAATPTQFGDGADLVVGTNDVVVLDFAEASDIHFFQIQKPALSYTAYLASVVVEYYPAA